MSHVLFFAMALAAALFVVLSATMNALFLSSLGRTPFEINALAALSVAADIAKAALPVVVVRAIVLRAWLHLAGASVMLIIVVVLSLASGTGFAAMTRGSVTAVRQAQLDELAAGQRRLRDFDVRIDRLADTRAASVVEAELAKAMIEWRWTASAQCTKISGASARQFCAGVLQVRADLAAAQERERLLAERAQLAARIGTLRADAAATESDPQAAAVAQLLGVDTSTPRLLLTTYTAVVIELGSVIIILLLTGPTLLRWREPDTPLKQPAPAVTMPPSRDVNLWHQRRAETTLTHIRSGTDGR